MDDGNLAPELISADLAALFQSATDGALDWTSTSNGVVEAKAQLKAILFDAQNGKCAYCRRVIRDEPGHYEIDHILPKRQSGENPAHWSSNDRHLRKATSGYPGFIFFALNLALTCKRCNNKKGTYDSRRNRAVPADVNYVLDVDYYEWIHIYVHTYSDHIRILEGLIYQVVDGSSNGDAVISTCKLDEIAAVERAAGELKAKTALTISKAIGNLLGQADAMGWDFIRDVVAANNPDVALDAIEAEVEKYKELYQ